MNSSCLTEKSVLRKVDCNANLSRNNDIGNDNFHSFVSKLYDINFPIISTAISYLLSFKVGDKDCSIVP